MPWLEGEEECSKHRKGPAEGQGNRETYLSRAPLVGMLRAKPRTPVCWKYGMLKMLAAMTATESEGFTKKPCLPRIMFRSFEREGVSKEELLVKLWKKPNYPTWAGWGGG